jgi:hypothetical protein
VWGTDGEIFSKNERKKNKKRLRASKPQEKGNCIIK